MDADDCGDSVPQDGGDAPPWEVARKKYARRGSGRALLRNHSNDEVVWHPHDMSPSLMREIVHMTMAGWVLLPTPGAGNMVLGALYNGVTSVAVCQDARIEETLRSCLQDKIAQAVCDGPMATLDKNLATRYQDLDTSDDSEQDSAESDTHGAPWSR